MESILNQPSIPFTVYLSLYCAAFGVIVIGGALLRWAFCRRVVGGYLLAGGFGSLLGFIVATLPFIYSTAQHYVTRIQLGYHRGEWPPSWWPQWLPMLGQFDACVLGSVLGFAVGCFLFSIRNRRGLPEDASTNSLPPIQ